APRAQGPPTRGGGTIPPRASVGSGGADNKHPGESTTKTEGTSMRTGKLMAALGLGFACLVTTATAPAQSDTSGTVSIESKSVALGVGVSWGDGTLTYRGKQQKFSGEGL